jgi:hypothetical protein
MRSRTMKVKLLWLSQSASSTEMTSSTQRCLRYPLLSSLLWSTQSWRSVLWPLYRGLVKTLYLHRKVKSSKELS